MELFVLARLTMMLLSILSDTFTSNGALHIVSFGRPWTALDTREGLPLTIKVFDSHGRIAGTESSAGRVVPGGQSIPQANYGVVLTFGLLVFTAPILGFPICSPDDETERDESPAVIQDTSSFSPSRTVIAPVSDSGQSVLLRTC